MAPAITSTVAQTALAPDPGQSRQQLLTTLQGRSLHIPDLHALMSHWPQDVHPEIERLRQDCDKTLQDLFPEGERLQKMRLADPALFGASWWPYASFECLRFATLLSIWVQLFAWDDDSTEFAHLSSDLASAQQFREQTLQYIQKCLSAEAELGAELPSNRIIKFFGEFGPAISSSSNPAQTRAFFEELVFFVKMTESEQRVQMSGVLPTVKEYRQRRMGSSAVGVCIAVTQFVVPDLVEIADEYRYALNIEMPGDVMVEKEMKTILAETNLLMVSGIGPKETLENLGIPVLVDRPGVGQNMWDHIAFSPAFAVDVTTHVQLGSESFAAVQGAEYIANRTGMLTNSGGDVLGFTNLPNGSLSDSIRTALDAFSKDWPDIEHLFLDGYFGYGNRSSDAPADGRNYVSSVTALMNPFSRGNVTVAADDTSVNPVVNPNWLLDPRDQEVAVAAFKQGRAVFTGNATRDIVLGDEAFPGLNVSSDDQILHLIQRSASSTYHASGTCAMGMANDSMAVLDSKARVLGVKGLRVVDASSFPVLPPGHPTSTICQYPVPHRAMLLGILNVGLDPMLTDTCIDALAEKIAADILLGA
ncbi:MAG: hypothetical protein Q9207_000447 [Kuettlingeria erythrocarpa]